METQTTKRFNLIDAIILVAATAAGLTLGRAVASDIDYDGHLRFTRQSIGHYAVSLATLWSIAILTLNLTRHFTTRHELACQPGFSALVAVVVMSATEFIVSAIDKSTVAHHLVFGERMSWLDRLQILLDFGGAQHQGSKAGAVAVVWLITAMAGCWRPEKTWIDRTGRALGIFWLLATISITLSLTVFPTPSSMPLTPPPPTITPPVP